MYDRYGESRSKAALTLIKDDSLRKGKEDLVEYTVTLTFLQSEYLPPFLPFLKQEVPRAQVTAILDQIKDLKEDFNSYKDDYELYLRERDRIWNRTVVIGNQISGICEFFPSLIKLLYNVGITHLVIFTNDGDIPWHWLYNRETQRFICEDFAVGIVHVILNEWGFQKFWEGLQYSKPLLSKEPTGGVENWSSLIMYDPNVSLAVEETAELYDQLSMRSPEKVTRIEVTETLSSDHNLPAELINYFLKPENTASVKIIHYAGHTPDGHRIDTRWLSGLGAPFGSQPIVFLNGCVSNETTNMWNPGSTLATDFLNKGASGCVVTNMPITDPAAKRIAIEFYKHILAYDGLTSNGEALWRARNKLDPKDPMRLFFTLYGDPRAQLSREKSESDELISLAQRIPKFDNSDYR